MMGVFVQMNENSPIAQLHPIGYVIQENGCWEWVGALSNGYGQIIVNKKAQYAHRILYERDKGRVPSGLVLDHLCRNRACVNPDHLEVVTNRENILRGAGVSAHNAKRFLCKRGHSEWGVERANGKVRGRRCLACSRQEAYARWKKKNPDAPRRQEP